MAIIILRDVETNEKIIVRSVIDPIVKFDKKGEVQIIQNIRWIFDGTSEFVHGSLYGGLNNAKVGMYVSLQYVIIEVKDYIG